MNSPFKYNIFLMCYCNIFLAKSLVIKEKKYQFQKAFYIYKM